MDNNELKHYGVPGMKWGKRKGRVTSEDSVKTSQIRKKKIREMSNQELQTANNRLTLERNYKQLTKKTNHGKRIVDGIIKTAGTITALGGAYVVYKKVATGAVDKIGNAVIKNIKI